MTAPALFETLPRDGLTHELPALDLMAQRLGTPLMEWQRRVARVASEHHPTITGAWAHRIVIVTVPRQAGKTTLMRTIAAQRTLTRGGQAFYTAQTGKDARERWYDLVKIAEQSFPHLVRVTRGAGAESMTWHSSGGAVRTFSPTRASLHGYTPALVMLDEAFAHDQATGQDLMGAIIPAQQTLVGRQLWIVSTAGTDESVFLREWVERGRASVDDPASDIAYFEWGLADGLDPYDPENWPGFHPAYGELIGPGDMHQAAAALSRGEFERAFCNRWTRSVSQIIPAPAVEAAREDQAAPEPGDRIVLAFDVAHDRSQAAIWAAWTTPDNITHIRPYYAAPGTGWLVGKLAEAREILAPALIGADDGGPARAFTTAARQYGLEIETLSARDFATATGDLIEGITTGTIRHNGDAGLTEAIRAAALRRLGETDALSRRASSGPVDDLGAAIVAAHHARYAPAPVGPPLVVSL